MPVTMQKFRKISQIEEITGCTKEVGKGANKAPRNPPSCFFISINTHKSNDFIILIIPFISSFKIK